MLKGNTRLGANRAALIKFLGPDSVRSENSRQREAARVVPEVVTKVVELADEVDEVRPGMIGKVPLPAPLVSEEIFEGKPPVGEVENIVWVADNMRVVDLDPHSCPSMRAWNMLCECRESAAFRLKFWSDHYSKIIPAKSMLENNKRKTAVDGQSTMDLIDRVRAMSDRIQGNTTEEAENGNGVEIGGAGDENDEAGRA